MLGAVNGPRGSGGRPLQAAGLALSGFYNDAVQPEPRFDGETGTPPAPSAVCGDHPRRGARESASAARPCGPQPPKDRKRAGALLFMIALARMGRSRSRRPPRRGVPRRSSPLGAGWHAVAPPRAALFRFFQIPDVDREYAGALTSGPTTGDLRLGKYAKL